MQTYAMFDVENRSDGQDRYRLAHSSTATLLLAVFLVLWCSMCPAAERASWYGEEHRGLPMANGQPFNPDQFTAASWFFGLGTRVVVTHRDRSVSVEITDRGPARRLVNKGRMIDLSRAAFAKLASPDVGLIEVTVRKQATPLH